MSLGRMTIISKDINGEKTTKLTTVVLVEFTIEIDLHAYKCEVMLMVKFSSNH